MFNILNLFLLVVWWSATCISAHGIISLLRESSYDLDILDANQEGHYDGVQFHSKKKQCDPVSKHVFYWLYTRENATGQLLNRSEPHMTESTTYYAKNPIKLLVHGWMGRTSQKQGLCTMSVKSYLQVGEYNVICVDWKTYSSDMTYAAAKTKAKLIAKDIARVLDRITYNMTKGADMVHLIGHSMGAHIVGFVGKIMINQIPRITGLDPAKPLYENSGSADRLDKTDSLFVDVMHTNGDKNGIFSSMGHIDFYPNGGKSQPNCSSSDRSTGACSHSKAYYYYALSILTKEDFLAFNCSSWDNFTANNCYDSNTTYMGEFVDKEKVGNYYLIVNE